MHIAVLGATGRVGSSVVRALRESGRPVTVRAACRDPDAAAFDEGVEAVAFDFDHPETWGAMLDGVEELFLLYPPGISVDTVRSFVDAADRVGVAHGVVLSILGAEKLPFLPHRRIERHVADVLPAHTFLRAGYFMQNLSGIHRPELVERDEVFVPAGEGRLGLVDARDVGAVAARALTEPGHQGEAYDLTGPESLDFFEVAERFSAVLDRRIVYANPGRREFVRRMRARGVPLSMVAFMLAEYEVTRRMLTGRTTGDVEQVLGRPPRSLATFVEDYRGRFEPTPSRRGDAR